MNRKQFFSNLLAGIAGSVAAVKAAKAEPAIIDAEQPTSELATKEDVKQMIRLSGEDIYISFQRQQRRKRFIRHA